MTLPPGVSAKNPKSFLFKPIKVDWKDFFKGLGKAVGATVAQRPDGAVSGLVDALSAISLTTDPGELAYRLIHRSLARALIDLVEETESKFPAVEAGHADSLSAGLENALRNLEFAFDKDFLERPAEFSGLADMMQLLQLWLGWRGLSPVDATAVSRRLPSYFVYALHEEWRTDLTGYKELAAHLDTPFAKAAEREWAWRRYAARLQRDTEESVFDEPFSLRQIYVPLNAYYYVNAASDETTAATERAKRIGERRIRLAIDLRSELDRWRGSSDSSDKLRVLSGGPGSGKSSFARILAADWAANDERLLYVPLHVIKPTRDLTEQIGTAFESVLGYNPVDANDGDKRLIVIFDGLDELASEGKVGAETARTFVGEVRTLINSAAFQKKDLRVILCGREPVVQDLDLEGRRDAEVLNLLPYFTPREDRTVGWRDPNGLLEHDWREEWWKNYGALTGQEWVNIPDELRRPELAEITPQPLLNYLVALSYSRKEVDFQSVTLNRNQIYLDLVKRVYERGYEHTGRHASIADLSFEDFLRVLEEVALATWHGDSRSTTVRKIDEYCRRANISDLLEKVKKGDESGVMNLLSAFFFRREGRDEVGDRTFVFTHKSFGEYLASRRFVAQISVTADNRQWRKQRRSGGWDEILALGEWIMVCGPSPVTDELRIFILDEIRLRSVVEVTIWQEDLSELFRHMLEFGMPMEKLSLPSFGQTWLWNRNSSEALLIAINGCAQQTHGLAKICVGNSALGTWLRQVQPQIAQGSPRIALKCLSFTDLTEQRMDGQALVHANLHDSDLSRCLFEGAWLLGANLNHTICCETDFTCTTLAFADFNRSDLTKARFYRADLGDTAFTDAILKDTDFEGAFEISPEVTKRWENENARPFGTKKPSDDEETAA
jgi:hypothetical protein